MSLESRLILIGPVRCAFKRHFRLLLLAAVCTFAELSAADWMLPVLQLLDGCTAAAAANC